MNKHRLKSYSCGAFLISLISLGLIPGSSVQARPIASSTLPTVASSPSDTASNALTPASSASDEQTNLHLFALEKQLFSEEYTSETVNQRLDRLDRFVLGSVQAGSVSKRLNRLMMDIPTVQSAAPKLARETAKTASRQQDNSGVNDSSSPASNAADYASANPAANAAANSSANVATNPVSNPSSNLSSGQDKDYSDTAPSAASSGANSGVSGEDYPTVDALEQAILGHTEEKQPLPMRLATLEQKAFGKPSPSTDDLALRVDRLKNYERSKNGGEEYLAQSPPTFATNQPVQTLSVTAKLDLIEKVVFAKTYAKDGVISRLNRLEKAVFPAKPLETFASVPARVNRLMTSLQIREPGDANRLAQNGFNSVPVFADQNSGRATNGQMSSHHSFLHKLGKLASVLGESALMSMGSGMGGMGGMGGGYPGMYGGGMYNRGMMY